MDRNEQIERLTKLKSHLDAITGTLGLKMQATLVDNKGSDPSLDLGVISAVATEAEFKLEVFGGVKWFSSPAYTLGFIGGSDGFEEFAQEINPATAATTMVAKAVLHSLDTYLENLAYSQQATERQSEQG